MSRLGTVIRRWNGLVSAAKEEQDRLGNPVIDVEHLFIALLVVGGPGGKVLSGQGITLRAAREASELVHAGQIAALGLTPPTVDPAVVIPDPAHGGYRWAKRAKDIMGNLDLKGDDRAVLLALIDEPSGHIVRTLERLGTTPEAVRSAAAAYRPTPVPIDDIPTRAGASVRYTGYVPAPPEEVWALVSDPARRMEWESYFYEAVEQRDADTLRATVRRIRPNGRPKPIPPGFGVVEISVLLSEGGKFIEWEGCWPEQVDQGKRWWFSIGLSPDGAGTCIVMTHVWSNGRRGLNRVLWPAISYATRQSLAARVAAISRALR